MTGSTILERNLGIFIIKMAATDVLLVLLFRLVVGLSNCFQRPSGQRPMIMSLGNLTINCKVSDSFASAYWSGDVRLGHCGCGWLLVCLLSDWRSTLWTSLPPILWSRRIASINSGQTTILNTIQGWLYSIYLEKKKFHEKMSWGYRSEINLPWSKIIVPNHRKIPCVLPSFLAYMVPVICAIVKHHTHTGTHRHTQAHTGTHRHVHNVRNHFWYNSVAKPSPDLPVQREVFEAWMRTVYESHARY